MLIFQSLTNYVVDFMVESPMDPSTYWTSKESSFFWVKLWMSVKNHSIVLHWIVNDLTSLYMIQVSVKRNFRIDCILWSQEILSFTYHAYQAGNYMFTFNSKNASIGYGICWKLTRKTPERLADVAQLLLTSNISDSLLYCFCCWLRASKCGLSEQHSK